MKSFNFVGVHLTAGQKQKLDIQRAIQASRPSVVLAIVEETLLALDALKESGAKPEAIWVVEHQSKGTLCIAEWMGF